LLAPLALLPALPDSVAGRYARDYYGASAPSRRHRTTTFLSRHPYADCRSTGTARDGSRVHSKPIDQLGVQLYSGSIANGYAADFHRGLPTDVATRLRS